MQLYWHIHREQERTRLWGMYNTQCINQWTMSPLQKPSWSCSSLKPSSSWARAWLTAVSSIRTNGCKKSKFSHLACGRSSQLTPNSGSSRPGAVLLQRDIRDVHRSHGAVRSGGQRPDRHLGHRGRRGRNRGWVEDRKWTGAEAKRWGRDQPVSWKIKMASY